MGSNYSTASQPRGYEVCSYPIVYSSQSGLLCKIDRSAVQRLRRSGVADVHRSGREAGGWDLRWAQSRHNLEDQVLYECNVVRLARVCSTATFQAQSVTNCAVIGM